MVSKINSQTKITLTLDELDSIIEVEGKVGRKLAAQKLISRHVNQPTRDDEGVITGSIWARTDQPGYRLVINSIILGARDEPIIYIRRVSKSGNKPYGPQLEMPYKMLVRTHRRTGLFI